MKFGLLNSRFSCDMVQMLGAYLKASLGANVVQPAVEPFLGRSAACRSSSAPLAKFSCHMTTDAAVLPELRPREPHKPRGPVRESPPPLAQHSCCSTLSAATFWDHSQAVPS